MTRRRWFSLRMKTWSSSSRRSVPAKRSAKAFMSGARTAVRTTRTPDDVSTPAKRTLRARHSWWRPGLLRAPLVGRPIRDRGMDDLSAAEVEEEEHEDLAETDVVRLDEVACPCDVVAQEGRPTLAIASRPGASHVPLNGALRDPDAKLEQFAADALGAPKRVARRHLPDQCCARRGRPSRRSRASPPEGAESGPMPAKNRRRLDE